MIWDQRCWTLRTTATRPRRHACWRRAPIRVLLTSRCACGGCWVQAATLLAHMAQPRATWHCFLLQGVWALHVAAALGHTRLIRTLLQAGASPFLTNPDGYMPIHAGAEEGHLAAARLLLDQAPQTAASASLEGITLLHLAAGAGRLEIVRLLLQASPEAALMKTANGFEPLFSAALSGHTSVVRGFWLLRRTRVACVRQRLLMPARQSCTGAPVAGRRPRSGFRAWAERRNASERRNSKRPCCHCAAAAWRCT